MKLQLTRRALYSHEEWDRASWWQRQSHQSVLTQAQVFPDAIKVSRITLQTMYISVNTGASLNTLQLPQSVFRSQRKTITCWYVCHLIKGESESDPHWVYCSKFLLAGLCHLMMCLERMDGKNFPSPYEYQQTLNVTNLLVRKAEMVFSSHLAYWSAHQPTHKHTVVQSN